MVLLYPLRPEDIGSGIVSENADQCLLPNYLWERMLQDDHSDIDGMYLVRLTHQDSGNTITLSVGGGHHDDNRIVYVPSWVFLHMPTVTQVRYDFLTELPPMATKIQIKPLDNALYCVDIAEVVSTVLSNWHVIQKGTIFEVPLTTLGGYPVEVFVENVEPQDCVLLRGEVPLELSESVETVPEFQPQVQAPPRPPTPIPREEPIFQPTPSLEDFMGPMVPFTPPPPSNKKQKFIPFQGQGRRLCDG
jgi:hypothetical protein